MSRVYDSWERLVGAVLSREKLRLLALSDSFDSSISAGFSSRFSSASSFSHEDVFATRASSEVISQKDLSGPSILSYHDVRPIEFEELKKATQNFGDLIWGGGGLNCHVYKGWIDEQTLIASKPGFGMPVAVKMWINHEGREEWLKEIHYLSQLHHPNLIKLVGHCSEKDSIYILLYEFMPKGSLDNHLFGKGHQTLSWATRIKVAIDVARALSFLHDKDNPVIHWNVKPSHVLLDGEFNAKLCGFGLATDMTDVSTWVIGSYGYTAPEYTATGYLTTKCDVYSFGIVVLELLSGRRGIGRNLLNLADWAKPNLWNKKRVLRVMDPKLEGQYSSKEVYDVANVALQCLSEDPKERPPMAEVLVALDSFSSSISADFSSSFSFASLSHEDVFGTRASSDVISQKDLSGPSILSYHDVRPIEFEELKKASQDFGDLIWKGVSFMRHVFKVDSVSSLEMNSALKWFPGSPQRVPPSHSTFSMSTKLNRLELVHLNMNQVVRATNNFSSSLRIGEGWFGTVYKAQLSGGQVVAIKRARKKHFEALRTDFRNEVELLAKTDHRNIVKLLGYVEKRNELLIITEYVSNGTLRDHLDGIKGKILDFNQRLQISIDVAHVLTYLHMYAEKQIIHRDVKSSNILLTESFRAKVVDFQSAMLNDDSEKTHVDTSVRGTAGYLDPEYMRTYELTTKSDVYSFGILLLEILTGRRPVEIKRQHDERVTIRWAFRKYNEGRIGEMVDPVMGERIDNEILVKMFGLALQCAAPTRADRPDMKAVSEQLWGIRMDYLKSGRTV